MNTIIMDLKQLMLFYTSRFLKMHTYFVPFIGSTLLMESKFITTKRQATE